ncbi:MAG: YnbE family lipoprotein [Proteobacteria bacterium]|nr:YnbE family lipoprotein [Pseudomonadota bacterium]
MNDVELTCHAPLATSPVMDRRANSAGQGGRRAVRVGLGTVLAVVAAMGLSGCITVSAPDKPIVIELNINIKQEVVYRLSSDAGQTIQNNKGIF